MMRNNLLYACYASSDFYARETGISMIGFFENNPDYEPDEFFILDYGIQSINKEKLNGIAEKYGKHIHYLPAKEILEKVQKELKLKDFRGSLATYSRAFIDKIMPDYVDRLFYIDSDTVVTNSISELKNFEMEYACMAGVTPAKFCNMIKTNELKLYSGNKLYYGCGIVLFDLHNWRERKCYDKICEMLNRKKQFPCADQTLINNALNETHFKRLSLKYNYTTHTVSTAVEKGILNKGGFFTQVEISEAMNNPVVVHYPGSSVNRPWFEHCYSRRKDEYYKYKNLSPWKNDSLMSLDDFYKKSKHGRNSISYYIHQLEIFSPSYTLLVLVTRIRDLIGNLLRLIGSYSPLPSEGME